MMDFLNFYHFTHEKLKPETVTDDIPKAKEINFPRQSWMTLSNRTETKPYSLLTQILYILQSPPQNSPHFCFSITCTLSSLYLRIMYFLYVAFDM